MCFRAVRHFFRERNQRIVVRLLEVDLYTVEDDSCLLIVFVGVYVGSRRLKVGAG